MVQEYSAKSPYLSVRSPLLVKRKISFRTSEGKALSQGVTLVDFSQPTESVTVVRVEKGTSYWLTDPVTGNLVEPKKVQQVAHALEITMPDGRIIRLEDFFVSVITPEGVAVIQANSEFLFFTGRGSAPYWLVDGQSNLAESVLQASNIIWPSDEFLCISPWTSAIDFSAAGLIAAPAAFGSGLGAALAGLGLVAAGGSTGGNGGGAPANGGGASAKTFSPVFTNESATATVQENTPSTRTIYTAHAIPDNAAKTITYKISGADALRFNINATTGEVTFKAAPNAESPVDVGADNVYNFTVIATDSSGLMASESVAITVQNIPDQPPVFTSNALVVVQENLNAVVAIHTVKASPDVQGQAVKYTLSGTDAAHFRIDENTGDLRFITSPNYENPLDSAGSGSVARNNIYDIIITATEVGGLSSSQVVSVEVQNLPDTPPIFTSPTLISVTENWLTSAVAYTAVAHPDVNGNTLTYTLGGTDALQFLINPATGQVRFRNSPNYEAPTDSGGNNIYDITVNASENGGLSQTQAVSIEVTNVSDVLTFSSASTTHVPENTATTVYTAIALVDGAVAQYSLDVGGDSPLFNINATSGAISFKTPPDFERPQDAGHDNVYNLTVVAMAAGQTVTQDVAITVDDVVGKQPQVTASSLNGVLNLDVQSNLVLSFNTAVQLSADAALKIRIVHDVGGGFHSDADWASQVVAGARDFEISITDASQIILSADRLSLVINPLGDLDFGSNYHIEISAGAFISYADPTSTATSPAVVSGLASFSTVLPSSAGQVSQKMTALGTLTNSQTYVDIEGRGNYNSVDTSLDLSSGAYTLVYKDYVNAGGSLQDAVTGIGTGASGFNLQVVGFGADDRLYFDDQTVLNALSANSVAAFGGLLDATLDNTPAAGNVSHLAGVLQIDPGSVGAPHAWIGFGLQNPLFDLNSNLTNAVISA